jgi:hypothetical protein
MIRVTVEMIPFGDESKKLVISVGNIWNTGEGSVGVGHYKFNISKRNQPKIVWKFGDINDFPRQRLNAWDLLYRALKEAVGDRNGDS